MKSLKYLEMVREQYGLKNDAELAREMGWATSKVSQYRTGKRTMENEACLAIALKLGIDPMPIIMAADIDRAERTGQRSLWDVFSRRTSVAAATLLCVTVNLFLTPTSAEAAPALDLHGQHSLYYVKLRTILAAVWAQFKRLLSGPALQSAAR